MEDLGINNLTGETPTNFDGLSATVFISPPSNCAQWKLNLVSSYSNMEAFYTLSAIILWIYDGKPPFILRNFSICLLVLVLAWDGSCFKIMQCSYLPSHVMVPLV
ncbi:hypothetical protein MRB53_034260 [Persea americana]|uniref:Uncharacterized protein n=1 Tax=Persea americana TaxID=3435 RepID=A0ACC2KXJ1_PERAE|nr:hypothetical protein MRB53_034260 [Persea americana]